MRSSSPLLSTHRKIASLTTLTRRIRQAQHRGQRVVFTNGCFDVVHAGHVTILEQAKRLGDLLIVAINSDRSVRRLKGPGRPILSQRERALLLAAFACVDYVTVFDQDTPWHTIKRLRPNVLVKGADWDSKAIVGRDLVEGYGGRVARLPLVKGRSTTNIIERIRRWS